jgi:predicted PurR-regulated permease PerM
MLSLFSRKPSEEVSLTISARTFFKVLLLILVTVFVLTVIQRTLPAFTLVIIAFFLALALNAPVSWVARHLPGRLHNNRQLATALAFLIVVGILVGFIVSVVPPVFRDTQTFLTSAPTTLQDLQNRYSNVSDFVVRYHLEGQIQQLSNELGSRLQSGTSAVFGAVTGVANSLFSMLLVLVMTFMMLIEGPVWVEFLSQLIPQHKRSRVERLTRDMYQAVRGYINGQLLLAVIASLLVLPGFVIFDVPYPFALMGLVFICGLIPLVGHTFGALIVSFIALFHSPLSALGILIYYILYQQVETYLIQPRIQSSKTNLSPLLILISLLVGASFAGLLGGLLAIPLVACLRIWLADYLETRYDLDAPLPGSTTRKAAE